MVFSHIWPQSENWWPFWVHQMPQRPEVGPELGEMRPCVEEDVNTEDEGWCSQPIHFPLHDFSMCRRQQAEGPPEPSVLGKTTFFCVVFAEGAEFRRDGNDFP